MAVAQALRTHCPQGHPYDAENTCHTNGRRVCLQCGKDRRAAKRPRRPSMLERLLDLVEVTEGCWAWGGPIVESTGYGAFGGDGRSAHCLMYEAAVGPIPQGLTLDHLCHSADPSCPGGPTCPHRQCVNPSHLEPVTRVVNVMRGQSPPAKNARKTHCPQGHPYDEANTYLTPSTGHRICRSCNRERQARRRGR